MRHPDHLVDGLEGLVIYKYKLRGRGQTVTEYSGKNGKSFLHKPLTLDPGSIGILFEVALDAQGNATFAVPFPAKVPAGRSSATWFRSMPRVPRVP